MSNGNKILESGNVIRLPAKDDTAEMKSQPFPEIHKNRMIAVSSVMLKIVEEAKRIAPLAINVLITGESGVGKEELAQLIHRESRRKGPFISVNCAALPEALVESELFGHKRGAFTNAISDYKGKFLMANNGTLFLDEIGDMPPAAQSKILQITDNGSFGVKQDFYPVGSETKQRSNFRLVCASNHDIDDLVKNNKFRQDLFFRLNVARFHIPPLRERTEEIPILAQSILQKIAVNIGRENIYFSPECLEFLSGLKLPGNVRELQNLIIRTVSLTKKDKEVIKVGDFKTLIQEGNGFLAKSQDFLPKKGMATWKKEIYFEALKSHGNNISKAAKSLGINPSTLYRFLKNGVEDSPIPNFRPITKEPGGEEKSTTKKAGAGEKKQAHEEKDAKDKGLYVPIVSTNEPASKNKKRFSRELLIEVLEQSGWSQTKTAQALETTHNYICFLVKKWCIKPPGGAWRKSKSHENKEEKKQEKLENEFVMLNGVKHSKETLILAFKANGWSKIKMAAALKVSYRSVRILVKKLNIKPPDGIWGRKPEFTKEKLESILKQNNWNQTKAAQVLGITQARLSFLAKNRGIVAPDGMWAKREQKTKHISKEALTELFEQNGWSQKRVAAKLGINRSCVSYLCTKRGIIPPSGSFRKMRPKKPTALEIILGKPWPVGKQTTN